MFELREARKITNKIENTEFLKIRSNNILPQKSYNHVGATITDSILQAGLNYNNVVLPRVQIILHNWASYNTTSSFYELINNNNLSELINWKKSAKTDRIINLLIFFKEESLEYENEIREWLIDSQNANYLQNIKGIGPKTIDYLKKLLLINTIPVDRHLKNFATEIGIQNLDYLNLQKVYMFAADLINLDYSTMDSIIWEYMSKRKNIDQAV